MLNFFNRKPEIEPPWDDNWRLKSLYIECPRGALGTPEFIWVVPHEYKLHLLTITTNTTCVTHLTIAKMTIWIYDGASITHKLNQAGLPSAATITKNWMNWDTPVERAVSGEFLVYNLPNNLFLTPGMRIRFWIYNDLSFDYINSVHLTFKKWDLKPNTAI